MSSSASQYFVLSKVELCFVCKWMLYVCVNVFILCECCVAKMWQWLMFSIFVTIIADLLHSKCVSGKINDNVDQIYSRPTNAGGFRNKKNKNCDVPYPISRPSSISSSWVELCAIRVRNVFGMFIVVIVSNFRCPTTATTTIVSLAQHWPTRP